MDLFNFVTNINDGCTTIQTYQKAWGEVGRAVEFYQMNSGAASILICVFIFLMTYFYMNIMIGLVIETI